MIAALYPVDAKEPFAQGLLMAGMYLFSIATALFAAAVIGRFILPGGEAPLILQMPPYRRPDLRVTTRRMLQRCRIFVREAGTIILACTIVLWALFTFPRDAETPPEIAAERAVVSAEAESGALAGVELEARLRELDAAETGARLRSSWAGRLGHAIEPTIRPLGFDWQIGIGLIGAFAAREVFVSTMAVVYGLGADANEESRTLRARIRAQRRDDGSRVFTPLTCLSLMVFFALACQCLSTLAVAKRETGGWRWPAFMFAYMTTMAWVASFVIYQGGRLLGFE
jgi:ferrous iron transport protein B